MKKPYVIPIIFLFIFFAFSTFVHAEQMQDTLVKDPTSQDLKSRAEDRAQNLRDKATEAAGMKEDRQEARQENRKENIAQRCEALNNRITQRIESFTKNKDLHVENYTKFITRVNEILTSLESKGYDVSELVTHVGIMDEMVKAYAADYVAFISTLEEAKALPCGQGDFAFRDAMQIAQDELKLLNDKRQEIRLYYAQVIRKDIADIRQEAATRLQEREQVREATGGENE